jgi:hypothetical protein
MGSPITGKHGPHVIKADDPRVIAVVCIVLCDALPASPSEGFVGVDAFFAVSGYLIASRFASNSDYRKFSFLTFYSRRTLPNSPAILLILAADRVHVSGTKGTGASSRQRLSRQRDQRRNPSGRGRAGTAPRLWQEV